MKMISLESRMRPALTLGAIVACATVLSGCMSSEEKRQANLYEDRATCAEIGARPGSEAHTQCMLQQQKRRDEEHSRFVEQAYMNSEMARNAQEMAKNRED